MKTTSLPSTIITTWRHCLLCLVAIATALTITGCATAPITGRNQLMLVPSAEMNAMAATQYQQVKESEKVLSETAPEAQLVTEVGRRIAAATDEYVRRNDLGLEFEWEFTVIESEQVNAWCMPGGKIAFYTGILPICDGANGIAVVMGHEVAHALARHGSERFSQAMLSQLGLVALDAALRDKPQETRALYMTAVGAGISLGVILPYGRKQEYEADHIGLILTAMAGYDPREAVDFWQRMASAGGASPPEFLSTHPASENRIEELKRAMPEAMEYYRPAASGGRR